MRLYHRTTPERARAILTTGEWVSRENTREVYFPNRADGHTDGYGSAVLAVDVPEEWAEIDDEFPDGEQHFRVHGLGCAV